MHTVTHLLLTALLLLALPGVTGCSGVQEMTTETNAAFAIDLYRQSLGEDPPSSNLFLSPLSVSTALAMTLMGAPDETAAQMCKVLRLPEDKSAVQAGFAALRSGIAATAAKNRCELLVANARWGQAGCGFRDDFTARISEHFGGGLRELDFSGRPDEARRVINGHVSEQTRSRISELIPEGIIDGRTRLLLTNVVYFKAEWPFKFQMRDTRAEPFELPDGRYRSVPALHAQRRPRAEGRADSAGNDRRLLARPSRLRRHGCGGAAVHLGGRSRVVHRSRRRRYGGGGGHGRAGQLGHG